MLPPFVVKILIFLFALLLPVFCALHNIAVMNKEGVKRWLLYLSFYCILECLLLPFEPALEYIFALFPLSLYWEFKFLYLLALVVPRSGILDKMYNRAESLHVNYGKQGWRLVQQRAEPYVKTLVSKLHQLQSRSPAATSTSASAASK